MLSCKIYTGKSCYRERDDTILLVCCFSSSFNRFKPQVWQKPTPELSVLLEQAGSIIVQVVSIMKLHVCNALMVILQVNLGP